MKKRALSLASAGLALLLVALAFLAACGQQPATTSSTSSTSPASKTDSPVKTESTSASAKTDSTAKTAAPAKPEYGGVLKILGTFKPTNFGYPPEMAGGSTYVGPGPLEPLLEFDNNLRFQPTGLATSFEAAKDGKSVTIALRKGVKFHDGTTLNAEAVKWNLDAGKAAKANGTASWTSIDAVDDYTVRINLSRFDSAFPALLGRTGGFIISPTAAEKNGLDWVRTNPVGTGPYKLKSFERDVSMKFERFDDYWGGRPYLDGLEWIFVADEMVQEASFKRGEAQVLYQASAQQHKSLEPLGYEIVSAMTQLPTLVPDSKNANSPLSKKKVREALEHAIDRKKIADALGDGLWRAVDQTGVAEYPLGYDPNLKGREYNPAKAKQLLAEAGYPNGFNIRVIDDVAYKAADVMVAIQRYWKDVGVNLTIEAIQRAKMDEYRQKGWSDGYVYTQMVLDPMYINSLERFLSPTNPSVYSSTARPEGWAQTFADARSTVDADALAAKTRAMVKTMHEEASILPLWVTAYSIIMDKKVRDTGFLKKYHSLLWSPEKAWLAK